jgi:succinate dehydrogenase / fumarate reductase, cytochrome b subunit
MENKKKRPVYLNLFLIRLPVAGVVSILHRVSGVALVLFLPLTLLALQRSLQSAEDYQAVVDGLSMLPVRVLLLLLVAAFAHHFLAGIRHLLLDIDIGITRGQARLSAWLVLVGTALTAVLVGAGWFL